MSSRNSSLVKVSYSFGFCMLPTSGVASILSSSLCDGCRWPAPHRCFSLRPPRSALLNPSLFRPGDLLGHGLPAEWCTHASVIRGRLTSFVAAPSNDMLMTYENATTSATGRLAEEWTTTFLSKLQGDPLPSPSNGGDHVRGLTGHFSFDFILSTTDGTLYPIECNARVHTAVILLPLDGIASCYDDEGSDDDLDPDTAYHRAVLRPLSSIRPRSWIYNDLIMRYLPYFVPSLQTLEWLHPCLPACSPLVFAKGGQAIKPSESPWVWRVDPTLVADDWVPFLVMWHVFWPGLLLQKWWQGKRWTRVSKLVRDAIRANGSVERQHRADIRGMRTEYGSPAYGTVWASERGRGTTRFARGLLKCLVSLAWKESFNSRL
jgi:hypothetical protein